MGTSPRLPSLVSTRLPVALGLACCAALAACGGSEGSDRATGDAEAVPPATTAAAAAADPSLDAATSLGVMNAHEPIPGLVTAGQITEAQMAALAEAGFTHFISLRRPEEDGTGWEEAWAAEHGADFTRLAIAGAGDLTRDHVEALDKLLDADTGAGGGTVLYCGSSNRVGAMLALRAAWLDGVSPDSALALGKAAGMTRLEPAVQERLKSGTSGGTR